MKAGTSKMLTVPLTSAHFAVFSINTCFQRQKQIKLVFFSYVFNLAPEPTPFTPRDMYIFYTRIFPSQPGLVYIRSQV